MVPNLDHHNTITIRETPSRYCYYPGPGCSKLTTSLVNVLLKFLTVISEIHQYFLLKNCVKLLQCKSISQFFNKKYQCIWLLSNKTLNELTS